MLYRRNPFKPRKLAYPSYGTKYDIDDITGTKELQSIPLPNEDIEPLGETETTGEKRVFSLDNIIKHIPLEEVILLGLIILLLDESLEDDFLLIILVYLLFTGIELPNWKGKKKLF